MFIVKFAAYAVVGFLFPWYIAVPVASVALFYDLCCEE